MGNKRRRAGGNSARRSGRPPLGSGTTGLTRNAAAVSLQRAIPPATHDYMLACGNPFIHTSEFIAGMPRVPDESYTGASAGIHYPFQTTFTSLDSRFGLMKSARAFGLGGYDVVGGPMGGLGDPTDELADVTATCAVLFQDIVQNKIAYNRWSQVTEQQSAARVVSSGMKLHDLGAVQLGSGQLLATHCSPDFIQKLYSTVLATGAGPYSRALLTYGLGGLFALGSLSDVIVPDLTGTPIASPSADATMDIIRGVVDATQVPQGNFMQEFVAQDGCSIRSYISGTSRPMTTIPPPVVFTQEAIQTSLISPASINIYMTSVGYVGGDFYGEFVAPFYTQLATSFGRTNPAADNIWVVSYEPNTLGEFNGVIGRITTSGGTDAKIYFICDINGIPLGCLQTAALLGLHDQGDAPMLYIEALGVPSNRNWKRYEVTWEEVAPAAGSVLPSTNSPVDPNWPEVVAVTQQFVSITKGFTFFGKLWQGLKSAVSFGVRNAGKIVGAVKLASRMM